MPLNTQVLRNIGPYVADQDVEARERSLVHAIQLLLEAPDVLDVHRRQLLDIALWKFTEASGLRPHPKYNLRFITDGARNLEEPASINHEHVWSRRSILDQLLAGKNWSHEQLCQLLRQRAVACVVTVEEHARLGDSPGEGWQRYLAAGISVWDRQEQAYLDLTSERPITERRLVTPVPMREPTTQLDLWDLIDERGGSRAPYLQRLLRTARFSLAAGVVATKQDGTPSAYFRIHDALLEEPTAAVAYPHWSGRVDFALEPDDVPETLRAEKCVSGRQHQKYAVSCRMTDDGSVETAEELLFLALQKLRASADDQVSG